jgi:pyroglutamyl-peptidase
MARARPPLLVTGFEPFGGETVNPAQELLAALAGRRIGGHRIAAVALPCAFGAALTELAHALDGERPLLVLALGQAGGRARLSLERVAVNLIDARIADNSGAQPVDVPVIAGAPDAYFSTLPVKACLQALQARGIPAELSLSAGSYVCNAVFFALRHLAGRAAAPPRVGFMHLPFLPAQAARHPGAPSMALETMLEGVECVLRTALETPVDSAQAGGTIC